MEGDQRLREFCDVPTLERFDSLSEQIRLLLVDLSFKSLFYKNGNLSLCKKILELAKEIKIVKRPDDSVEGEVIVYIGDPSGLRELDLLYRTGVIAIPFLSEEELAVEQQGYLEAMREFPEYKRHLDNPDLTPNGEQLIYVLGKFAALGNPSSFHAPWIRNLRMKAYRIVREKILLPILNSRIAHRFENGYTEMLCDRLMHRLPGQAPEAESFHRDVIPAEFINESDEIFGGWINLDSTNQYFSAVRGSHLGVSLHRLQPGFARVPNDQIPLVKPYATKKPGPFGPIACPPGHMILFPQYIVHQVMGVPATHIMKRLFTGWRLCSTPNTLHPGKINRLEAQAIMPLPSNQMPPMFSLHHGSAWMNRQFHPISRTNPIEYSTGGWLQDTFKATILRPDLRSLRFLDSLQHYEANSTSEDDIKMYQPYSQEELALYRPISRDDPVTGIPVVRDS